MQEEQSSLRLYYPSAVQQAESSQEVSNDLRERDARDMNRSSAPLKPAEGAHLLDTSEMTVEQAVHQVLSWYAAI